MSSEPAPTKRPRKIAPPGAPASSAPQSSTSPTAATSDGGVIFVKNQIVEKIKFSDGTYHQFTQSKTLVEDPELIAKLREAAQRPGNPYGIFEVES